MLLYPQLSTAYFLSGITEFICCHMPVVNFIDLNHRSHGAGTQTIHAFYGEKAIWSYLTGPHSQKVDSLIE